eukprot:751122_1
MILSKVLAEGDESYTALAYDYVHGMLACGTKRGGLFIYGRPGIKVELTRGVRDPRNDTIFSINFFPAFSRVVSITVSDCIEVIDLVKNKSLAVVSDCGLIECSSNPAPKHGRFLFFGDEYGELKAFDVSTCSVCQWKIKPCSAVTQEDDQAGILDAQVDPQQSVALIYYTTGHLILYSLSDRSLIMCFQTDDLSDISCLEWYSRGDYFATGHKNGEVNIWSRREQQREAGPLKVGCDAALAVRKMFFDEIDHDVQLYVFGGVKPRARRYGGMLYGPSVEELTLSSEKANKLAMPEDSS